jgi:hypothetical protein
MDQKEKRQLENQLLAEGLAKLNSPELIEQMANLVNNWPGDRHEFLMGLINECDDRDRSEMYNSIRPHLKFKPLPLDTYVAHIAERAGAMVSQNHMRVEGSRPAPIRIGRDTFVAVPKAQATGAVATVKCHRCPKVEKFVDETPAGAMLQARKAGWIREPGINKECCAECAAQLAHSEEVMLSRTEVLIVTDKRRAN